jgi:hypothetical protein
MSAADRQRARRARIKAGRAVLRIEVDDVAVPEALVDAGFLHSFDADNREAIEKAIETLLTRLSTEAG